MYSCCEKLCAFALQLPDEPLKKSLLTQMECISDKRFCIENLDMIIYTTDDGVDFCNNLLDSLAQMSVSSPSVKMIVIKGKKQIEIASICLYLNKIRKIFEAAGSEKIQDNSDTGTYKCDGILIKLHPVLCRTKNIYKKTYSETQIIVMLLSLSNAFFRSPYLELPEYPQVNLIFDEKLRDRYNFGFLHDIAVYISMHSIDINWENIFGKLAVLNVTTQMIIMLRLINYIYGIIPYKLLEKYVENALVADEEIFSSEIIRCINDCCTADEIVRNDYRSLYRRMLTDKSTNGTQHFYSEREDTLSYNTKYLEFLIDQNTNSNPYGTAVFHGSEADNSDELSAEWGVWQNKKKLCFLLKIHNKFIVPENDEKSLEHCRMEIIIASADDRSHKFTEISMTPSFSSDKSFTLKIKDNFEYEVPLSKHLNYIYIKENNDLWISLAVDFSYLHISEEGSFGVDIITSCADSWSCYKTHAFRKSLTWTGKEALWRDIRSFALMKPFPAKVADEKIQKRTHCKKETIKQKVLSVL